MSTWDHEPVDMKVAVAGSGCKLQEWCIFDIRLLGEMLVVNGGS